VADVRPSLGRQIRKLRRQQKLTQEALAERSGLSYKYIGEVERGSGNATVVALGAIAEALGVSIAGLFTDTATAAQGVRVVTLSDYSVLREAHDSLEQVLRHFDSRSGTDETALPKEPQK